MSAMKVMIMSPFLQGTCILYLNLFILLMIYDFILKIYMGNEILIFYITILFIKYKNP